MLPTSTIGNTAEPTVNNEDESTILLDHIRRLPCNHIFHRSCLHAWFQRQQTCPTCRADVLTNTRNTTTQAARRNEDVARPNHRRSNQTRGRPLRGLEHVFDRHNRTNHGAVDSELIRIAYRLSFPPPPSPTRLERQAAQDERSRQHQRTGGIDDPQVLADRLAEIAQIAQALSSEFDDNDPRESTA
ncbi:hypothetical protein ACOME3_009927 [Neoechinorhynchus agilis]